MAAIFLIYAVGSVSSAAAGRLFDRFGRRTVLPAAVVLLGLGVSLTAASSLLLVVGGLALLTGGFFAAHSVASSSVGCRTPGAAAQASGLYLLAYYLGSSVAGPVAGTTWSADGWAGILAVSGGLLASALFVSLRLRGVPTRALPAPVS